MCLVESSMRGVLQSGNIKVSVIVDCTIADQLHLRDAGNGLEIRVKNRLISGLSLVVAVAIRLGFRIKCLGIRDRSINGQYTMWRIVEGYLGQPILLFGSQSNAPEE